ncbi:MAG: DUF4389 domain-containing protein [Alphaproteobacteria bacterium]|nr:DUF4389 domain-containing protein [Alphaproteobacteria bacterium]MDE2630730.1 DUF4389 domain-containing protein [Alphaproteobacteria bacterium]
MTDVPTDNGSAIRPASRPAFPALRLLYAIGFAVAAWVVFWVVIVLAAVQFVLVGTSGKLNDEVKNLSLNLVQYLWELLAFITFIRDEQPFPIGPFPHSNAAPG